MNKPHNQPHTGTATPVVGIGEVLWDVFPGGRRLGGAPANFAFHARARGLEAVLVSGVGEDPLGAEIVREIEARALDSRWLSVQTNTPTGTVRVEVDAEGVPAYIITEDVAWDHLAWTDGLAALAGAARAVCYGTLGQRAPESRVAIRRFLAATAPDCLRVCDINLRAPFFDEEVVRDSLGLATVLKLNGDELPILAGCLGLDGAPLQVLSGIRAAFGLDLVALTRGSQGSLLFTAEQVSDHPGLPVAVVDTVGAGDAFTASLVAGLLRDDPLDAINGAANAAAARVCSHAGATPDPTSAPSAATGGTPW